MMSASQISAAIRAKKKQMKDAPPELIHTSPKPDMDAQDIYDLKQRGRIEDTLGSAKKINADETMMNSMDQDDVSGNEMAAKAKAGIMEKAHVPAHSMDGAMKHMADGGVMHEDLEGLSKPPGLMSMAEDGESDWNKEKFKRKGRLSSYLDSLDI